MIAPVDYKSQAVRFPMSATCIKFETRILFPTVRRVDAGVRRWYERFFGWTWWQNAIGGFFFTKERRAATPQPGLGFHSFKAWLGRDIFQYISGLNEQLVLKCDYRVFFPSSSSQVLFNDEVLAVECWHYIKLSPTCYFLHRNFYKLLKLVLRSGMVWSI